MKLQLIPERSQLCGLESLRMHDEDLGNGRTSMAISDGPICLFRADDDDS
jgi:hypothetical protein